jgi:tetratricopeptide (TPR) repeat protein
MPGSANSGDDVLQRAVLALQNQRPNEAEWIAGDLLKKNPRHSRALHIFGCALLMQDRAKDAIAPLQEAARARHDPEIDTQLAIALRKAGQVEDALTRLKRAIKRRPPYAAAFHELGFVLFSMQRYDEAIDVLRRGLEVAPMMPEMSIQLGNVLLATKDRARAKAAFSRALAINPALPDALFGMGMAHQEDGEYEAASHCFRSYLAGRPNHHGAWMNLGHCLLELGQRDAGYGCFRRASRTGAVHPGKVLGAMVKSGHGRFWLKPSAAARFFKQPDG